MDPQGLLADDADPDVSTPVAEPTRPDPEPDDDDPTSSQPPSWEPL